MEEKSDSTEQPSACTLKAPPKGLMVLMLLGPGMMWERFRDRIEERGGEVRMRTSAAKIRRVANRVVSIIARNGEQTYEVEADHVISSMALPTLIRQLDPPAPPSESGASVDAAASDDSPEDPEPSPPDDPEQAAARKSTPKINSSGFQPICCPSFAGIGFVDAVERRAKAFGRKPIPVSQARLFQRLFQPFCFSRYFNGTLRDAPDL